jgi:hypothetical protein
MATGDRKIDIINDAFSMLRISGLTVNPRAEDNTLALTRLEDMAAKFFGKNICIGYNFESEPDFNSKSGVSREFWDYIKTCLAIELMPDFGKGKTDIVLQRKGVAAYSFLSTLTATIRRTQPPTTMPLGSGNRRRYEPWMRYNHPDTQAPTGCETNKMIVGDINDFTEDFNDYLNLNENIDTYTIEADTGLTIVSDSDDGSIVSYRVEAAGSDDSNSLLQIKIIITTTNTRVLTRLINFELSEV